MRDKDFLTGLRWALMEWRIRRIKAARALRGMSAEQLVAECSWEVTLQRQLESGKKSPTPGQLYEMALALDVDVAYFIYEEANPFAHVVPMGDDPLVIYPRSADDDDAAADDDPHTEVEPGTPGTDPDSERSGMIGSLKRDGEGQKRDSA